LGHWKRTGFSKSQPGAAQQKMIGELLGRSGGETIEQPETNALKAMKQGGTVIHEVGGAIMGDNPGNPSQSMEVKLE